MVKTIGFFVGVGTGLTAALLWLVLSDSPVETVSRLVKSLDSVSDEPRATLENCAEKQPADNQDINPEQGISTAEHVCSEPADPGSRRSESPASDKAAARRLLYQARQLALQGEIDKARDLARRADAISVDWSAKEQSPDDLLNELKDSRELAEPRRLSGAGSGVVLLDSAEVQTADGSSESEPDASAEIIQTNLVWPTAKEQAAQLLDEARADLKAGRREDARAKAEQADKMNVVYTLFDERPELILKEVDRLADEDARPQGILIQPRRNLRAKRLQLLESLGNGRSADD